MFYEKEEIKNILNCKKCSQTLDEPKIFPCGLNICSSFTGSIHLDEERCFKCIIQSCDKKHLFPNEGLPVSELISLYLTVQIKPKEVYRGEAAESLWSSLQEIKQKNRQL